MKRRKFRCKSSLWLLPDLIESDAFLKLSGKAAILCLLRFHQKAFKKRAKDRKGGRKTYTITNQGAIIFTYAEARELGIRSSETFSRVLRELIQEKGFIDKMHPGNPYAREPARYAISERLRAYATRDFQRVEHERPFPQAYGFKKQK